VTMKSCLGRLSGFRLDGVSLESLGFAVRPVTFFLMTFSGFGQLVTIAPEMISEIFVFGRKSRNDVNV
jgi:hypothetical protein